MVGTDQAANVVETAPSPMQGTMRYANIATCFCLITDPSTNAGIVAPAPRGIMEDAALRVAGADVGPMRMRVGTTTVEQRKTEACKREGGSIRTFNMMASLSATSSGPRSGTS